MDHLDELQEKIGYRFKDRRLLVRAMTHSSYVNEHRLEKTDCNERLEFLGDSILEMLTSIFLYKNFPSRMEGDLSKYRASIVCERALAESARALDLGNAIILGHGMELGGGRSSDSVLSDAFEALLAALYLDGSFETARRLIDLYVTDHIDEKLISYDSKTMLQELLQDSGKNVEYRVLSESGPEHEKTFEIGAYIDGALYGKGTGHSKKSAQQAAAYETIKQLRV